MVEQSLKYLLNPESIAIVGASPPKNNEYQFNSAPLDYLIKYSSDKDIYPVNPKYDEIEGYKCYSSILDIPDKVDVALLIISVKLIDTLLKECEQKGVKSIIIAASGYAETGEDGIESQKKLKEFSERTGISILGPNTLGLVNVTSDTPVGFSVALEGEKLKKGNIGFVSQSGATMSSIVRRAKEKMMGFSHLIDTGNEAILDVSDFIEMMLKDENVEVITVVAESIKNIDKFISVSEEALRVEKPIVILKMGRSRAGKISALSHTGSMAGASEINDALYKQKNILIAQDIDDMLATAELLSRKFIIPAEKGIGVASTSGGGAGLTADLLEGMGLNVSELSNVSVQNLENELDSFVKAQNPFDFAGQFIKDSEIGEKVFKVFAEDQNTSLLLFALHPVQKHSLKLINQLVKVYDQTKFPFILLWMGDTINQDEVEILRKANIPHYTNMTNCIKAITNVYNYQKYSEELKLYEDNNERKNYKINDQRIKELLTNSKGDTLSERESKYILNEYGLPVTKEEVATDVEEAVKIADEIGYPVVLKIEAENVLHKTDIGGVKLGIKNQDEVKESFEIIMQNYNLHYPTTKADGVLIQEMVEDEGTDFILGMKNDPECGPTLLFGLGGIFTEIIKEYSLSVLPLNPFEVDLMLSKSKFNKLFDGFRGIQVDHHAVKDFILRFGQLCWDYRNEIEEIEVNPIYAFNNGKGVIALDALIKLKSNAVKETVNI